MLDREFVLNEWLQRYRNAVAAVLEHVFLFKRPFLHYFITLNFNQARALKTQQTIWTCASNNSSYSICIDSRSIFLLFKISAKGGQFELGSFHKLRLNLGVGW